GHDRGTEGEPHLPAPDHAGPDLRRRRAPSGALRGVARSLVAPPLDTRLPAVVLGVEHPRGLAVLRSLAAAGVAVVVVDRYPQSPGLRSRWPHRAHLLDTDDDEQTLAFVESLDVAAGALLIATSDYYVSLVATNHARLARRFTLTTPTWDVLEPVLDKP